MGGFTVPVSDSVAPQGNSVHGVNNTTNPAFVMPTSDADTLAGDVHPEDLKSGAGYDSTVTRVGAAQRGVVGGTDTGAVQQTPTGAVQQTPTVQVQQAIGMPITPMAQTNAALFPNGYSSNPTWWGDVKDIGSLPLRVVAGTGLAVGEAGKEALSGQIPDPSTVGQTFMSGMANPSQEANKDALNTTPYLTVPVLSRYMPSVGQMAAGSAENPFTLPGLAMGGGLVAQGVKAGLVNYLSNVADRLDQGQTFGAALTNEDKGQLISDLAPLAIGAGLKTAGAGINAVASTLGEAGMQKARDLLVKIIKPAPMANGGQEAKGLAEGLKGSVNGQRIVPQILDKSTFTAPQIADNYRVLKAKVDAGFEPTFDEMTAAGVEASPEDAMDASIKSLDKARSINRLPITDEQADKAIKWAREITGTPEDPEVLQLRREVKAGRKPDFTVWHDPNTDKVYTWPGNKPVPEYFKRWVDDYKMPSGETFHGDPSEPTEYLSAKQAHFTKSQMMNEAHKSVKNKTAKSEIAHAVGTNLREQLTVQTANPSKGPDHLIREQARDIARAKYAAQLANARPLYAMEDAMIRAENTGANRNPLSLGKLVAANMLKNPLTAPIGIAGIMQEMPQTALALDWMGSHTVPAGKAFEKIAGTIAGTKIGSGLIDAAKSKLANQIMRTSVYGSGGQPRHPVSQTNKREPVTAKPVTAKPVTKKKG
jgi:hypothetical protein